MKRFEENPALADAADVLSDQLRSQLLRLAELLGSRVGLLDKNFRAGLQQKKKGLPKLDEQQVAAVLAVTPGAAMRILARGGSLAEYFEQVAYNGRRLAKLNLPPGTVLVALEYYDRLLGQLIGEKMATAEANPVWVREQLLFCIMLTLNNAFYVVRETETRAFYELFRAEVESRTATSLIERIAQVLLEFSGADEAQLFLEAPLTPSENEPHTLTAPKGQKPKLGGVAKAKPARRNWIGQQVGESRRSEVIADSPALRNHFGTLRCLRGKTAERALELTGAKPTAISNINGAKREVTLWCVPLQLQDRLLGFIRFTFFKDYEWLPREQELLAGAAERCSLAIEKAKLMEDLALRSQEVQDLASRMMNVEEAERRRISRELHDESGQGLLCVRLSLEMVEERLRAQAHPAAEELLSIRETVEATIIEIRRLISALSPAVLEQLGLAAALRQLVNRFRTIYPCTVKVNLDGLGRLPRRTEMTVYRLVQECFQNIAKHSQANTVNLSLSSSDNCIRLLVHDNGVGFHLDEALAKRESYGLSGMRERVALLGGRVSVVSSPAAVTTSKTTSSKTDDSGNKSSRSKSAKKTPRKITTARGTRIQVELPIPREAQSQNVFDDRDSRNAG